MDFTVGKLPQLTLSNAHVAVVIRGNAVEVVERTGRGKGARITKHVRVPIVASPDVVAPADPQTLTSGMEQTAGATPQRQETANMESLATAIKAAMVEAQVKTKRVIVSLPSQDVLLRFFTLPNLPKSEWDSAIQFEARKYVPFKMDTMVWDYEVLENVPIARNGPATSPNSESLGVIFMAAQRQLVQGIRAALTSAGLQASRIEPAQLSLARFMTADATGSGPAFACFVDVEPDGAHVVIVRDGQPYLGRDMTFQLEEPPTSADGGNVRVQRLLSELRVCFDFFTREHPTARINTVWLFGDEGTVAPWCDAIAGPLQCPVKLGTELLIERSDRSEQGLPLSFASAVGLLRSADERSGVAFDLLKNSESRAPKSHRTSRRKAKPIGQELAEVLKTPQAWGGAALAIGALALLWMLGSQQIAVERSGLERLVQSRPVVGWGLDGKSAKAVEPIRKEAKEQLALVKQLVQERVRVAAKLDALARSLPDGIWVTELNFEERFDQKGKSQMSLTVSGACYLGETGSELGAIQDFEAHLKQNTTLSEGFQAVRIGKIDAQTDARRQLTYRTFQVDCRSEGKL